MKLPTKGGRLSYHTIEDLYNSSTPQGVAEFETQQESKTDEDTEEPKLEEERDKPKLPKRPKQDSALRVCDHVKTWTR